MARLALFFCNPAHFRLDPLSAAGGTDTRSTHGVASRGRRAATGRKSNRVRPPQGLPGAPGGLPTYAGATSPGQSGRLRPSASDLRSPRVVSAAGIRR